MSDPNADLVATWQSFAVLVEIKAVCRFERRARVMAVLTTAVACAQQYLNLTLPPRDEVTYC